MDENGKDRLSLTIIFDMFVHKLIGVAYEQIAYVEKEKSRKFRKMSLMLLHTPPVFLMFQILGQ